MAKRKPKKDKDFEPPTLVAYWDKLTEGEIMQINNAVTYHTGRCYPGILPFTSMATICASVLAYVHMVDNHKGVYYRLLAKLESHKYLNHWGSNVKKMTMTIMAISDSELQRLVPLRRRYPTGPQSFKFKLPFDTKSWAKVSIAGRKGVHMFQCAPKHVMALRAWLELT